MIRISKINRKMYNLAAEHWGDMQIDIAIEEMAELIDALCKLKRERLQDLPNDFLESEIADVIIMMEQLTIYFNLEKEVKEKYDFKSWRLGQRLNDEV